MSLKKSWKFNALLVLVSLAVALGLSIIVDRAAGRLYPEVEYADRMELIFPPNTEQEFKSTDFQYTVKINSLGLRDREIDVDKDGKYRILAIGDSFTYGWGVDIDQTWVRCLERDLNQTLQNVELINCGKPGTGPPDYANISEKVIPLLKPDLVIVCVLQGDDLAACTPEGLKPAQHWMVEKIQRFYPNLTRLIEKRGRAAEGQPAAHQPGPPSKSTAEDNRRYAAATAKGFIEKWNPEQRARYDGLEERVRKAFENGDLNPHMINLAMQHPDFYKFMTQLDDSYIQGLVHNMAGYLIRIKRVAERYGTRVIVLSIPPGMYVNERSLNNIHRVGYDVTPEMITTDALDRAIETACRESGLPFHQVTQLFKDFKESWQLFYELDYHLTATGHQFYAQCIRPIIEQEIGEGARKR